MSTLDSILDRVGNTQGVLVEGESDQRFFEHYVELVDVSMPTMSFHVAERKKKVIKFVEQEPSLLGIVDRDEWSVDHVQKAVDANPNLYILPRFCIENYFCVPMEVWQLLAPSKTQNKHLEQLESLVLRNVDDWVKHGAMWRVTKKRYSMIVHESDFPKNLQNSPIVDEDEIKKILNTWAKETEPEAVFQDYIDELKRAEGLTLDEKLKTYIHGKKFFLQVIVPALSRVVGQQDHKKWRDDLTKDSPSLLIPDDLRQLLENIRAVSAQ